eukprot:jgi/Botrbrau1/1783/Bobra.0217s0038.1
MVSSLTGASAEDGLRLQGSVVLPDRFRSTTFRKLLQRRRKLSSVLRVWAGEARSSSRSKWASEGRPLVTREDLIAFDDAWLHPSATELVWNAAESLQPVFAEIDRLVAHNLVRVQRAFRSARVGPHHFAGSTGYGHGDLGRAALDEIMASVMGGNAALVRSQFVSGTHAISTALFAILRPGDEMVSVAGSPYDTLEEVIGIRGTPGHGSLREWGVKYREVPLDSCGKINWAVLSSAISPGTRVAHVQRSCGYAERPTLSISEIGLIVKVVKAQNPNCIVFVDNCYGEFTEKEEPCSVGADLVAGSLIKGVGGTLAVGGGYIAGKEDLVAACAARLTAPGVGIESGCVSGETLRLMMQGLFLAPQMVGEALKGGRLVASVMAEEGYIVSPTPGMASPMTFVTSVRLGSPEKMSSFCRAVQRCSPIGSYIEPVPGETPGYGDQVIFGNGTFVDGSTAELTADGPLREPFTVYCQGGTHWTHWGLVLQEVVASLRAQ